MQDPAYRASLEISYWSTTTFSEEPILTHHSYMQDPAYWASWAISHWSTMAVSGALCALVGTYPFSHSSATLLLAFYWLVAAVRRLARLPLGRDRNQKNILARVVHTTDAAGTETEQVAGSDGIRRRISPVRQQAAPDICASGVSGQRSDSVIHFPHAGADQLRVCAVDAVLQEPHRRHVHGGAVRGVYDPRVSSSFRMVVEHWMHAGLPTARSAAT